VITFAARKNKKRRKIEKGKEIERGEFMGEGG